MDRKYKSLTLVCVFLGMCFSHSALARGINYVNIEPQLLDCSDPSIPCPGDDPPQDESNVIRVLQSVNQSGDLVFDQIETNSHWDNWVWLGTKVHAQCSGMFRLSSASIRVGANFNSALAGNIMSIPVDPHNKTIPGRHVNFHAPLADILSHMHGALLGDDLIAFGNEYIDALIAAGANEAEARAQTFHFNALVPVSLSLKCFRQGLFSEYALGYGYYDMPLRIEYVGHEPINEPAPFEVPDAELTGALQVTQVSLSAIPDEPNCAVDLSATFVANNATHIQYRFVDELGVKSQIFQVSVDQALPAFVHHRIDMVPPEDDGELDFVILDAYDDQIDDLAQGESSNVQGYFQIEVIYPHYKVSNVDSYNMACDNNPTARQSVGVLDMGNILEYGN